MIRLVSIMMFTFAMLIAACAGGPQTQPEPVKPAVSLEFRLIASEDGEFADLQAEEYPANSAARYRWLELAREDAVQGTILAKRNTETGAQMVPVQVIDEYNITGADITNIKPTQDGQGGMAVNFEFSEDAAERFEAMTSRHKEAASGGEDPRLLAIIIENRVYAAYNIKDTIRGGVQLSGQFTSAERDDIIKLLRGEGETQ